MDNLLNFPVTTIVDKNVPKNAFFKRARPQRLTPLKQFLTDSFEHICWGYKLHPTTLNISKGEQVHEIVVFICQLRTENLDLSLLAEMDAILPQYTLFVLRHAEATDIFMQPKAAAAAQNIVPYGTPELLRGVNLQNSPLRLVGQQMDTIYYSLLGQVSGLGTATEADYRTAVALRKECSNLQKQLAALQNKIRTEKQFNLQLALNSQAKALRQQLAEKEEMFHQITK